MRASALTADLVPDQLGGRRGLAAVEEALHFHPRRLLEQHTKLALRYDESPRLPLSDMF